MTTRASFRREFVREYDILKEILDYLAKLNVFCWVDRERTTASGNGTFRSGKGIADIVGIYKGKPLAIEVKRPGGDLSMIQFMWLERFKKNGGVVVVATSIDDVRHALSGVK